MLNFYRKHTAGVWAVGITIVLVLLVSAMMLEAKSRPISGTVVDKRHIAEFVHVHTNQTCVSWINGTCQQYAQHTHMHTHPDEYYVIIEGFNYKDEFRTGRWSVDEHEYRTIEIGQEWSAQ